LRNREGAFSRYHNIEVEVVGYTTCDGCPGGNIEYAVGEMKGNGAEAIHLANGLVVGYPSWVWFSLHFLGASEKMGSRV